MNIIRHLSIATLVLAGSAISGIAVANEASFDFGHAAKASQAARTVKVTLADMYFSPNAVEIKAGETVRFELANTGAVVHEFTLGDAALQASHQKEMLAMATMGHDKDAHGAMTGMHHDANSITLKPGESGELTWTFTRATALEFACNEPGHYQAGMVGRLTVDK
jgi:uncharacterized cupredoxin-like copper-binding protein